MQQHVDLEEGKQMHRFFGGFHTKVVGDCFVFNGKSSARSVAPTTDHATPFPLELEKAMDDETSDSASDWSGDGREMVAEEGGSDGGQGRYEATAGAVVLAQRVVLRGSVVAVEEGHCAKRSHRKEDEGIWSYF
jgi:hypothetical protein